MASPPSSSIPHVPGPVYRDPTSVSSSTTSSSSSSSSVNGDDSASRASSRGLQRPKLGTRKSSGTIIVPREHPRVELKEGDEVFDEDDARAMSPRRSSQDLEKMSQDAREQLNQYVTSPLVMSYESGLIVLPDTLRFSKSHFSRSSTESRL